MQDKDTNFKDNNITYNRKLKLEEYDEKGNLIDCVVFNQKDLWDFYILKNNMFPDIRTARKNIKDYFNTGNTKLKNKLLMNIFNNYTLDDNVINSIELILTSYSEDEIEFALDLKDYSYNECSFFLSKEEDFLIKSMSFFDILKWIKNSDGIYYAIGKDGAKGMAYLTQPTKKQAFYQRTKNDKSIVFLSFTDWKEHLVSEKDLK